MWCSRCQQDVPGIANPRNIRCARCGEALSSGYATAGVEHTADDKANADGAAKRASDRIAPDDRPPIDLDDWKLDDDLRAADRLIKSLRGAGITHRDSGPAESPPLLDAQHPATAGWHVPLAGSQARRETPTAATRSQPRRRGAFFSSMMVSLGLMMFVCGGVLLGWSLVSGRGELWSLGLPLILIGQAALIVGLVFQLDGLWQSNRETSQTLEQLDDQLHDLQHATTMLGTTHSGGARSFYAHMAEGASPQMLLTDLKGQMDLLAVRLAQTQRRR